MTAKTDSIAHLIHRAGQIMDAAFLKVSGEGLRPRAVEVLRALANAGDTSQSQTDLVEATGIDRSTLSDIVRRLEERSLVSRARSKHDARAYTVKITAAGRRAAQAAETDLAAAEATALQPLVATKQAQLRSLLNQIVRASSSG